MQAVTGIPLAQGTEAYSRLRAQVRAAGILDRCYSFYAAMITLVFGGYALSLWGIYSLNSWPLLALACLGFTFFSVQLGGLMHDAGHRAVFNSTRLNNLMGLACALLLGMVFDNWRTRHNAHHAFPNQPVNDPDLEVPFLSIAERLLEGKGRGQRALIRFQSLYYYPLGAIVSFSNRLGTFSYFRRPLASLHYGRLAAYLLGTFLLFVAPFLLFSLEKALFVFVIVHISSGIYLMNCFAPNHKGMPVIYDAQGMSFIEQQVVSSRNVSGGKLTDFLLVGLNYQVEHHLFPTCPRNKLNRITPMLREVCDELGLEYVAKSFIETNHDIVVQLHSVQRYA